MDDGTTATERKRKRRSGKKQPDTTPRRRGRPRKEHEPTAFVPGLGTNAQVVPVELTRIDQDDKTFQFRVNLRVGDLVDSIRQSGQQVPAILRKLDGHDKLQIISGFRRITAIGKIGWPTVNAIVLEGISNEDAWRTSVLENEARKTYSDLDRGYAIEAYRKLGYTVEDVAKTVFKLSRKQATRLNSLVALSPEVREAIADERITTTHALVLKQLCDKLGGLDFSAWIERIGKDRLSIRQLRSAVLKGYSGDEDRPITLFVRGKDKASGRETIRFRPVRIEPQAISGRQRSRLIEDLKAVLAAVERKEGAGNVVT